MLGAGLNLGRNHRGDDRFYVPMIWKRNNQNQMQQEQIRRAQSEVTASDLALMKEKLVNRRDVEVPTRSVEVTKPPLEVSGYDKVVSSSCNLERFLESITPSVPAQYISKTTVSGWKTCDMDFLPYFELGDLWNSFKEWSAYGAGVPLVLDGSDGVIQYYVPYLSGIQIYGNAPKSPVKSRRSSEESDSDDFRDSSSDGSNDCELGLDGLSLTQNDALQEDSSGDNGECLSSQGCLLFEYYERSPPYSREPLADKVSDLTIRFPELNALRSCDLLSSSWMSVAWYPIYRIPTGPTLKDLDACFLTFHSLHTPVQGAQNGQALDLAYPSVLDGISQMPIPVFGMVTYKFKGSVWCRNGGSDRQLVNSLMQAADSWLRLLHVNHPDYSFFCSSCSELDVETELRTAQMWLKGIDSKENAISKSWEQFLLDLGCNPTDHRISLRTVLEVYAPLMV